MKNTTKFISKIFLITAFFCLWFNQKSFSQTIVAAEYFFNTDPGVGNGTPLSFTAGDSINPSFTIPTTSLSSGYNHLFIRFKNNLGKWSHYENRTILIKSQPAPTTMLVRGEYFFDTDPGVGNATPFNFTSADNIDLVLPISTTGLTPGYHTLFFRVKDVAGKWSHYYDRIIYIKESVAATQKLVFGEYFFNTDPGLDSGVSFTFLPVNLREDSLIISTAGLSAGVNYLFFRYRDSVGIHSLYEGRYFRICDVAALADFKADTVCLGDTTTFTNLSTGGDTLTKYIWDFDGNGTSDLTHTGIIGQGAPSPFKRKYTSGGTFQCSLITDNGGGCSDTIIKPVVVISYPAPPTPSGASGLCINNANSTYTIPVLQGATSYEWTIDPTNAGVITSSDTSIVIDWNNTFVGTVQLTVKGNYGPCTSLQSAPNSPSLSIIISPQSIGGTISLAQSSICEGSLTGNITLSGNLGTIIRWEKRLNNGTQWIPISWNSSVYQETPSGPGTWDYRAVVKNGACIEAYSNYATITVNPNPSAAGTIIGVPQVCQGQYLVAYTVPAISGATSYTWTYPYGATISSGIGTNSILVNYSSFAATGAMTVFGSNSCGVGAISPSFNITVNPSPVANAGADLLVIYGGTDTLSGSAFGGTTPYSYAWSPSSLLVNANIHNPITVSMVNSTPFTLTVTDSLGCQGTDQVNYIVYGQPLTAIATADPSIICQGANSNLNVLPNGGTGTYTYTWSSNPPGYNSVVQNPVVSPTATTQYVVLVNDGNVTYTSSVTITISPKPGAAGTISGSSTVCKGQNGVTYTVPLIANASGYSWNLPFGATIASGSNTNTIVVNFAPNAISGNITVFGTNNCGSGPSSQIFSVTTNQIPVADAGPLQNISLGAQTTLQGSASGGSGNYSYVWAPATLLVNPNIQNPQTVGLTNSTTFTLTVTDNTTTCTSTATVLIQVSGFPLSVATSSVPTTVCQGGCSQINALPSGGSGTYAFSWSSNPSGFTSTSQTPTVCPTITTEYIVTVTAGSQSATSNVMVTVSPLPTQPGTITGDNVVCRGDNSVQYSVPVVPGASIYYWSLPPGASILSGTGTNTILVNYSLSASSGSYNVYASNFCGNSSPSNNYPVTVNILPVADAGVDVIITIGGSDTLHGTASGGSGNYSYAWSPALLLDDANIANPITIPLANSQIFTLSVTDNATGCIKKATVQVIVAGGPLTATASASPQTICEGSSTQLNALPQGGTPPYTYEWTSIPAGFTSTLKNPIDTPTVTTEYTVLVADGFDQTTASIVVNINPLPNAGGTVTGDTQVCRGETGVLYSVPTIVNATGYNWTLPTGVVLVSGSNTNSITANFSQSAISGDVTVAGTNFCGIGTVSPSLPVHVDTLPFVFAGIDRLISQNDTVHLYGTASGGTSFSYSWSPPAYLVPPTNVQNPVTIDMVGSVLFTLNVTNTTTGCQNSDQMQVIVGGLPLSVQASADPQTICQNGQSTLFALPTGGTGTYTYTWSSNPSGFNSNTQNPVISPTVTTTYLVLINDGAQTNTSQITVSISTLPGAAGQITGPTAVCRGVNNVNFSIPLIQGATSYVWTFPNGATIISGAGTNSVNVNFSLIASSGLISVNGVNACGSGTASNYQITVNPLPTANAGPDLYIFNNTFDTLNGTATGGSGVYSYIWAPSILLDSFQIQNPHTVLLSNPTTFYLTVTDAISQCSGTDNMTIYILNSGTFSVSALASPQNICQGQTSTLNAIPTGGTGNYAYSWTSNPSGFTSPLQNPIATPTVTTTYYLSATSGGSTVSASAYVIVSVNPLPSTPGTISGTNVVCQGTSSIIYTVPPVNGATSYNWSLPYGASIIAGQGTNSITVNFSSVAVSGPITVTGVNLCGAGLPSPAYQVTVNASPVVNAGADQGPLPSGSVVTLMGNVTGGGGPFGYLWIPSVFINTSTQGQLNAVTVNLQSSVTFILTVLDSASGCSASDQMNVYIGGGALSMTVSASQTNICQGQTIQLNALPSGGTGNYQYLWSSYPAGFTSTLQNPNATPSVTTQYIVMVTDGNDSVFQNIVVIVNPQPATAGTITGTSPVCQGATVMFTVPPISNATSYIWNMPQGFTIVSGGGTNTVNVSIANNATSGSISVYSINNCGVGNASPYLNVVVDETPFAYTSADQIVPVDTFNIPIFGHAIGGSGTYTYTWAPAQMLNFSNIQDPIIIDSLHQSTVFTLTVTDNVSGCQSTDQIQIIVYGGPLTVAVSSSLYSICAGESVQLNALPSGGNGQYTYSWTPPSGGLNNASIYNPVATPTTTTEYIVQVVSGGLTATNHLIVTVFPQSGNAGTITGNASVCQGETGVMFTVPSISNATTYYWTVPYGATIVSGANSNNIMVNFAPNATSGNISVYGGNVCGFGNASPNFWVNVHPIPNIYAGPDQQIQFGDNTSLNGLVSGSSGYTYQWTPANLLIDATVLNPITLNITASQIFTLYVTDTVSGCLNSDYMKVIICGGPLTVDAFVDNNNICEGQTVQLDALPSGGNCVNGTYSWSSIPTGIFSSTLVNPVATPTVSTTYIVQYSDGTNSASDAVSVTVHPLVGNADTIQGLHSVCQNSGTVTYSVPPITGATSYVWTFPQGTVFTSNPDSNVVEVIFTDTALSGFISVYASSLCGFGSSSPAFPVTVKPIPGAAGQIVGPSYMTKNNTAQFTVPAIPGVYTYNWVLPYGAVIINGQGTNSITVEFTDTSKSGFIYVYGINSCGSGDASFEHLLTIITSLAEIYGVELNLYPNPSNGEFVLDLSGNEEAKYDLKVLNLFGSEVYSSIISEKLNRLDLNHLPNGMYYLVLTNDKMKIVEKFVIVK